MVGEVSATKSRLLQIVSVVPMQDVVAGVIGMNESEEENTALGDSHVADRKQRWWGCRRGQNGLEMTVVGLPNSSCMKKG